ncbi:glucuronate isomerase [Halopelagius longus]|uniref:Uronate isomerase n=1 Tax=Halopelagius longus TaxID=1236180 RepID=A0A1H1G9B7_9EURY|nr:glucuronate isomerase [Halopelagius longus]RDI69764.1 glucuronate isomerase [Halopelagius longus]SDR09787.1 D-glucuronate isomerase [Halopelagius longus]
MGFIDEDYLLQSDAAADLYDAIADLPVVDPHNHIDVAEVVENEPWTDIWEVEGATDHYVWQLMRKRGVPEEKITGDADNREKWNALAEVCPDFAGNPTYEWIHLDLKRRFGVEKPLNAETADEIWAETKRQLADPQKRPQEILREMNVEALCSSDDPTSRLEYHERAETEVEGVDIRPTWRPDRALKVENAEWSTFVSELDSVTESDVEAFDGFLDALAETHEYFVDRGCVACDVGVGTDPVSKPVSRERAGGVYEKARRGDALDDAEVRDFKAFLLEYVGELNAEAGWVTQLHVGAVRDYRDALYDAVGPNAGGDVSTQDVDIVAGLDHFLDAFDGEMDIVLYTLDPTHYPSATVVARAYPNVSVGPAWWFNDSPFGLANQLERVAAVDLLANYAGMVSDSRKLVSYGSRFEMFRRTLANVAGEMVERGQIPADNARRLVERVAYDRPKELYGL